MANIIANAPFNQYGLNLGNLFFYYYNDILLPDVYQEYGGRTFEDVYLVSWSSGFYVSVFGGSFSPLSVGVSGTVTGYTELYYSGASLFEMFSINEISVSAEALVGAAMTPTTSDEYLLFNTALAGDDSFQLSNGNDFAYGLGGNDVFFGLAGSDYLDGGQGDDVFFGGSGDDFIIGGGGRDTSSYSSSSERYSVTISRSDVTVQHKTDLDGTDTLNGVEELMFSDGFWSLSSFDGAARLSSAQFSALTEMYIAYFNRAPDSQGLLFWGDGLSEGLSLGEIAAMFFASSEAQQAYPDSGNTRFFVETVYNNVLGRPSDPAGLAYWVDILDRGVTTPEAFILNVLDAAKAHTSDRVYLEKKTDLGLYFSAIQGLSDAGEARHVMDIYDGTDASMFRAKGHIDLYVDREASGVTGEFIVKLAGIVEDPFSAL